VVTGSIEKVPCIVGASTGMKEGRSFVFQESFSSLEYWTSVKFSFSLSHKDSHLTDQVAIYVHSFKLF